MAFGLHKLWFFYTDEWYITNDKLATASWRLCKSGRSRRDERKSRYRITQKNGQL